MRVEVILGLYFLFVAVVLVVYASYGGAYTWSNVERDGFCKINYGEDYVYIPKINSCSVWNKELKTTEKINFPEEEFKVYCSEGKVSFFNFLSWKSTCWKKGGVVYS